ncbi:MAG: DUF4442 domain-containing protein [Saprospiraceae bacterium]|nr:DUF4442 domain-containing protein [Saprospiraceae bacterium]
MSLSFLETAKRESFQSWRFRTLMNWYPMYFGTGGKILFWSSDNTEVHLRLRLNLWTYNYVGTIYGGSFFSASDPFYMLMLMKILGKNYVIWDKSADIRFKIPAKTTLYAVFKIEETDIASIKREVAENGQVTHAFTIKWVDKNQVTYAEINRFCYIADKDFYKKTRRR